MISAAYHIWMNTHQWISFLLERKRGYKRIGFIKCASLNNMVVYFNSIGFNHLIHKRPPRSREDQIYRLNLIPYATNIIEDKNLSIVYRSLNIKGKLVHYWGLEKIFGNKSIRVVIRQVGNGRKHFYSIMEHTSKNPAKSEIL